MKTLTELSIFVILIVSMDFALFNYAKIYFSSGDARNDNIRFRIFCTFKVTVIMATVIGAIGSKAIFSGEQATYASLAVLMAGTLAVLAKSYVIYLAHRDPR